MQVVQVKCPKCGDPIYSKQKDTVFLCARCGTMHIRNGGIQVLDVEIGDFNRSAPAERVYVPFWRMYSTFIINHERSEGGGFYKMARWFKGDSNSGDLFIWVPAAEMDIDRFKNLAMDFTMNPPQYTGRTDFNGVSRLPTAVSKNEAEEMADFVVVTIEAEKPGVLQQLDYSLTVHDARLIYLPFVTTPKGLVPAY